LVGHERTEKLAVAKCWSAQHNLLIFLRKLRVIDFRFVDDGLEGHCSVSSE
jgi:hypothetical protein